MDTAEYYRLAQAENSHWWCRSTHQLVLNVLKGLTLGYPRSDLPRILDAGCGTGGLTKKLEGFGRVIGLDILPLALSLAQKRSLELIEGSVNSLPFSDECFDLITCISVLYHQRADDATALKEFYRVLKPGRKLLLFLPAFSWAWGNHDEAVHTRRRYNVGEASDLVKLAGFKVTESHYAFSLLFPVFIIKRLMERIFPKQRIVSDLEVMPSFFNNLLFGLCRVEWKLGRYTKLPFGSSLLVVGEKE